MRVQGCPISTHLLLNVDHAFATLLLLREGKPTLCYNSNPTLIVNITRHLTMKTFLRMFLSATVPDRYDIYHKRTVHIQLCFTFRNNVNKAYDRMTTFS